MSMPSLSSSPWMRGAPHSGLSRLIWRISSRVSWQTGGRPGWPRPTFQVQNSRNPFRCHWITVSGFTMTRADRQPDQNRVSRAQRNRSAAVSLGRFTERCKTLSWIAKSEHLNLKSDTSAKAIPRQCENGHQRRSWYEETEAAQLSMYQPNPDFREPQWLKCVRRRLRPKNATHGIQKMAAGIY